jgi:parallel beta-helix repeat protein
MCNRAEIRKTFSAVALILSLMFSVLGNGQPVGAALANPPSFMSGPLASIYILSNGTVVGTDSIQCNENSYTFTSDIKGYVVVQKDNIVIDGAGYTLSGEGSSGLAVQSTTGINLVHTTGVAIQNLNIVNFVHGISPAPNAIISRNYIAYNHVGISELTNATVTQNYIAYNEYGTYCGSTRTINNKIVGNTLVNNREGIQIINIGSTNDVISGNNFTGSGSAAIALMGCSGVTVSDNSITATVAGIGSNITAGPMGAGIRFESASNNRIFGNYIAGNSYGICFSPRSNNNIFYYNDFVNQVQVAAYPPSSSDGTTIGGLVEIWDNGTVGNYWSDYLTKYSNATEIEGSGIGNTPYIIDAKNQDNYPLMAPVNSPAPAEALVSPYLVVRPSLVGSQIEIEGTLSYGGVGVSFAPLQISYSDDSGTSWNDIAMINTDFNGNYYAMWLPPATGTYQIKVSWDGNVSIPKASTVVYLVVAASQENDLLSVASNSTITLFNFNTNTQEITFNVSGPSDTTGYVKIYVSKTLFQNIAEASVYLDGAQLDYTTSSTDDSWILYFVYSHSMHSVTVTLAQAVPESPNSPVELLAAVIIVAITASAGLLVYFKKRKH